MESRLGRRQFLLGGLALTGWAAAGGSGAYTALNLANKPKQATPDTKNAPVSTSYTFRSAPALNGAPRLNILSSTGLALGDYILLTPLSGDSRGAAIFNNRGRLIWYRPSSASLVDNLQVVRYQGRNALAWYEGQTPSGNPGYGTGECILVDAAYGEVRRIRAGGGEPIDLHELVVTEEGTALVESYLPVQRDLSGSGGANNTSVLDWRLEEVDLDSGETLFTWRALDHVPLTDSVLAPPSKEGEIYDYFHGNSIEVGPDGNLLISARNTSALYKIDRKSGNVLWQLRGGSPAAVQGSLLALQPEGESFWFQHDARWNSDGTLSLFDDGATPFHHSARGLVLQVDEAAATATILRSYGVGIEVDYMGSSRLQANGNWLIGWGGVGRVTEFNPAGEIQLDATFAGNSYRAVRCAWQGQPGTRPAVYAERSAGDIVHVWASWNGATALRSWQILAGDSADALTPSGTFQWRDFETEMQTQTPPGLIAVRALDSNGAVLGTSSPVAIEG